MSFCDFPNNGQYTVNDCSQLPCVLDIPIFKSVKVMKPGEHEEDNTQALFERQQDEKIEESK